jgi:uncharacterized membrane protein YqhA
MSTDAKAEEPQQEDQQKRITLSPLGIADEILHTGPRLVLGFVLLIGFLGVCVYAGYFAWSTACSWLSMFHNGPNVGDEFKLSLVGVMEGISLVTAGAFTVKATHMTYVKQSAISLLTGKRYELPTAYDELTSGIVKVKMAGSWIGFSSIYLLDTFVKLDNQAKIDGQELTWQAFDMRAYIHLLIIAGFVVLGIYEWISHMHQKHSTANTSADHTV